jgi:glucose dehydrogenase
MEEVVMRKLMFAASVAAAALASPALANDDVAKNQANPNFWASQSGDYAATRYSTLDQINTSNVADLKVAWTFSTGSADTKDLPS